MPVTFTNPNPLPSDCNGNAVRVGMVVYLPDGWNGVKPRPWKAQVICGVSFISGRYYLDFDGYPVNQCAANSVCVYNPYPVTDESSDTALASNKTADAGRAEVQP